ncbi:MAG TPA: hypothetical protein VGR02_20845 [Thermoanaerobaculia bacterium]|nr:hypothetical protein [Thermoanaerobaculia bacterium]
MKSPRLFLFLVLTIVVLYTAAGAHADGVDMTDPRRALGREDDVRVDAQLIQDTVSSSSPLNVRYQIQNFTDTPVAVADKISDVSYDSETATITLSIGAEVPKNGAMPHLVLVAPGQKKVLNSGGVVQVAVPNVRSPFVVVPRFVQIKVNVLRDVAPFRELIAKQEAVKTPQALSDAQFDRWVEANDAIFLNAIPVHWQAGTRGISAADQGPVGSY